MHILNADDIARRVNWPRLIDAADCALDALANGDSEAPVRSSLSLANGSLLTMPARMADGATAIVKVVSVIPGNADRGRPTIQGVAALFDAHSGEPLALFDGAMLTLVRTAAVSAAATRRLADPRAHSLALLGAGSQAPWHARALASLLPLDRIRIWSPTPASRARLAADLAAECNADVQAVDEAIAATRDADVICCATTARSAFLHDLMLADHRVHVIAIGAFRPDMAEVAPSVFRRAGCAYVERAEEVLHEGGDVIDAIAVGALAPDALVPVGRVKQGDGNIPANGLTVFKSVGNAVEDATVSESLYQEWQS